VHEFIYGYLMTLPEAQNYEGLNDNDYGVMSSVQGNEALLAWLKVYPGTYLEKLWKTTFKSFTRVTLVKFPRCELDTS
jgi:hypothetical protein